MMKPLNHKTFKETLTEDRPMASWSKPLQCLWYDAKGDWEASHNIAQDMHNVMGSWLHAYLHRKEGDDWNAAYWYRMGGKPFPETTLSEEFSKLLEAALNVKL